MTKDDSDWIEVKGAKTHNLKDVSVKIPRNKMTVFTGLSGSGKSSLAFDTIFSEGQRRYVESLSAYARQFLHQMSKPDVEEITGLSPAISIDQKNRSNNPRSTVATITEIYDYLRVLFSRIGIPSCVRCKSVIEKVSKEEITKRVELLIKENGWTNKNKKVVGVPFNDREVVIYAPVVIGRKGEYYQLLYDLLAKGYEKVRIDGKIHSLRERINITKNKKHDIDALIDSIFVGDFAKNPRVFRERLNEAIEHSLNEADGLVRIGFPDKTEDLISSKFLCAKCGFSFPEIEPRLFSFNSPYGACPDCNGLGTVDLFVSDKCKTCGGDRLRKEALSVFLKKKNIVDLIGMSITDAYEFFRTLKLNKKEEEIARPLINEIESRISFMLNVGLDYLTMNRKANTLSGGEAQRIRLASQLGSGLVGALYVLDEPTIGLHQRDNDRLIKTLVHLRNLGNTIIVVEHDEETIYSSDYIVDIGPGAGLHGGEIVVSGYLDKLLTSKTNQSKSVTLDYLRGDKKIEVPKKRRGENSGELHIESASKHNIKKMDAKIPLGKFVAVTGVSGSGKSTFLYDILYENLKGKLQKRLTTSKSHNAEGFKGYQYVNRVILVDQSPIGRTPRSTPATYTGAFTHIRDLFSSTEKARYMGWKPGRFSFNVKGGRCETCEGNGVISVEMHFLPTVYVKCDSCSGRRFSREVLEVKYRDKSIFEVLSMSVEEGLKFFSDIPAIHDRLQTLSDVGLDYLTLGQSSTTLSGGEAQRIKISSELYRPGTRKTVYLLDEPTVGLHYEDVVKLIDILNRLVDRGNTVVVIEHNLDVIKSSDYVIDIGPEGGLSGGEIVAKGTPEQVAMVKESHTGRYLKKLLKN